MERLKIPTWIVLALIFATNAYSAISIAPVSTNVNDGSGNALTSTGNALDVNVKTSTALTLGAGSAIVGKFGIDQTTPGTTNLVQVGGSLPAGSNLLGKLGIDQTTPGTTNAVSLAHVGSTAVATGNGVAGAGVQRVTIASDNSAISVTSAPSFKTRADIYTTTANGTTVDASLAPQKYFSLGCKATGAVTSWTVVLEGSLDNANFTTILTHSNVTPADGQIISSGTTASPMLYFRTRATAVTLGSGTNVICTLVGQG